MCGERKRGKRKCVCVCCINTYGVHSFCRLLKDKPNFKFEFRGKLEFKNVPAPVSCYYLVENTSKEEFAPIVVTDEQEQTPFQFMMTNTPTSPPVTPMTTTNRTLSPSSPGSIAEMLSQTSSGQLACPMYSDSNITFSVPDFNVIKPTPTSTPNPSPPGSKKNSISDEPIMFTANPPPTSSPTPPLVSPIPIRPTPIKLDAMEGVTSSEFTPILDSGREEVEIPKEAELDHHHHSHMSILAHFRKTSMSPVHEDNEEEGGATTNVDEGIEVCRKSSDMSNCSSESGGGGGGSKDKKQSSRKVSDTSAHSGESGIESPPDKQTFTNSMKEPGDAEVSVRETSVERKLSNSSSVSMEEELETIRHSRSGSVSKAVEMFDTFTRHRKSGLTMVGNPKPSNLRKDKDNDEGPSSNSLSPVTSPQHKDRHPSIHCNGGTS